MWKALQYKSLARLFYASLISQIGSRIHRVALLVLIYTTTGNVLWVSFALGVQLVASVGIGPMISGWADAQERRRLLVMSDVLRALLVPLIPLLGVQSPAILLSLIFILEVLRNLHEPVASAIIPELVPEEGMDAANALMLFSERFAQVAFTGLAGVLVAAVGFEPAFWIDALTFLLSSLILLGLPHLQPTQEKAANYLSQV